mmetsp:Transcript_6499/g.14204  ORF Transcript_6499/g.14204 Transcript_6499/m.14204 type:complete len:267 (-) Transcript_6499:43-843(-)|eukprot:CAMPEP_0178665338 /NCGR_PEP_ID=MMETSP0698-20121128/29896_1 /TAXON_ID=265572 /ORGANISM="Extubocellulus spinifer, Strain CCMP396" /LENGTH=266 /DNA_ID=CAMNT_0020308637 /DNA_START=28 /DNA_END=828 /DNA_ORIENTATION=+
MKNQSPILALLFLLASCLCVADGAAAPVVAGRRMGPLGRGGNRSTNSAARRQQAQESASVPVPSSRGLRRVKKSPNNIKRTPQQPQKQLLQEQKQVPANRNNRRLSNGGFEHWQSNTFDHTETKGAAAATGWSPYMGGYTASTAESRSGQQSIAVKSGGAVQKLYPTNAVAGRKLKLSGYAKSVGVSPIHHGPAVMSVYADVKFVDGSWLRGQEAEFAGGTTEGWEYAENTIPLLKDVEAVHLYAVYYGDRGDGVAYFDDFDLQIL